MKANKLPLLIMTFTLSIAANAQTYFIGSIKHNVIERTKLTLTAIPDNAPGFTSEAITPEVKNSFSYSAGIENRFVVGKSFHMTGEIALDMMQLNIVSGVQKRYTNNTFTYYSSKETNELIPRIRAGFGIDLIDINLNNIECTLGMNAAQMISLNTDLPSYSVVGANLKVVTKNISFFLKASMMPYNIQIGNISSYVGDLNAKVLHFESAYRIKELQLGFSIPFHGKNK
jgi:hypothetical protein